MADDCSAGCLLYPDDTGDTGKGNPCPSCPHEKRLDSYGEAEYIADNYGVCALLERCVCLRPREPWLGRGCPSWRPVSAKTFDELRESLARG